MIDKKELYGDAVVLLGTFDGWDYGIWYDSDPEQFVFLKPLNEEEFVMMCIGAELGDDAYPNKINGTLVWDFMRGDDEYHEIEEKEFNNLVRNIKKRSKKQ